MAPSSWMGNARSKTRNLCCNFCRRLRQPRSTGRNAVICTPPSSRWCSRPVRNLPGLVGIRGWSNGYLLTYSDCVSILVRPTSGGTPKRSIFLLFVPQKSTVGAKAAPQHQHSLQGADKSRDTEIERKTTHAPQGSCRRRQQTCPHGYGKRLPTHSAGLGTCRGNECRRCPQGDPGRFCRHRAGGFQHAWNRWAGTVGQNPKGASEDADSPGLGQPSE